MRALQYLHVRVRAFTVAFLAAAALLSAAGAQAAPSAGAVRAVLIQFVQANHQHDGAAMCSLMTAQFRADIAGTAGCASSAVVDFAPSQTLAQDELQIKDGSIPIHGNGATFTAANNKASLLLTQVGGHWLLSGVAAPRLSSGSASAIAAVRAVMARFYVAFYSDNGQAFCSLVTPTFQLGLEMGAKGTLSKPQYPSCTAGADALLKSTPHQGTTLTEAEFAAKIAPIVVHGNTATFEPGKYALTWTESNGHWLLKAD